MTPEQELIAQIREKWRMRNESQEQMVHRSIQLLSHDIYSSHGRYLEELIQNIDDNEYDESVKPSICIIYSQSNNEWSLSLYSNEKGFSREDIESICSVGMSTKAEKEDKTGKKGIGFKSVFRISDNPHIISGPHSFCLNSQPDPQIKIGFIIPTYQEAIPLSLHTSNEIFFDYCAKDTSLQADHFNTVIHLPVRTVSQEENNRYQKQESIERELRQALIQLSASTLAFLRRLKRVSIIIKKQDNEELWIREIQCTPVENAGLYRRIQLSEKLKYGPGNTAINLTLISPNTPSSPHCGIWFPIYDVPSSSSPLYDSSLHRGPLQSLFDSEYEQEASNVFHNTRFLDEQRVIHKKLLGTTRVFCGLPLLTLSTGNINFLLNLPTAKTNASREYLHNHISEEQYYEDIASYVHHSFSFLLQKGLFLHMIPLWIPLFNDYQVSLLQENDMISYDKGYLTKILSAKNLIDANGTYLLHRIVSKLRSLCVFPIIYHEQLVNDIYQQRSLVYFESCRNCVYVTDEMTMYQKSVIHLLKGWNVMNSHVLSVYGVNIPLLLRTYCISSIHMNVMLRDRRDMTEISTVLEVQDWEKFKQTLQSPILSNMTQKRIYELYIELIQRFTNLLYQLPQGLNDPFLFYVNIHGTYKLMNCNMVNQKKITLCIIPEKTSLLQRVIEQKYSSIMEAMEINIGYIDSHWLDSLDDTTRQYVIDEMRISTTSQDFFQLILEKLPKFFSGADSRYIDLDVINFILLLHLQLFCQSVLDHFNQKKEQSSPGPSLTAFGFKKMPNIENLPIVCVSSVKENVPIKITQLLDQRKFKITVMQTPVNGNHAGKRDEKYYSEPFIVFPKKNIDGERLICSGETATACLGLLYCELFLLPSDRSEFLQYLSPLDFHGWRLEEDHGRLIMKILDDALGDLFPWEAIKKNEGNSQQILQLLFHSVLSQHLTNVSPMPLLPRNGFSWFGSYDSWEASKKYHVSRLLLSLVANLAQLKIGDHVTEEFYRGLRRIRWIPSSGTHNFLRLFKRRKSSVGQTRQREENEKAWVSDTWGENSSIDRSSLNFENYSAEVMMPSECSFVFSREAIFPDSTLYDILSPAMSMAENSKTMEKACQLFNMHGRNIYWLHEIGGNTRNALSFKQYKALKYVVGTNQPDIFIKDFFLPVCPSLTINVLNEMLDDAMLPYTGTSTASISIAPPSGAIPRPSYPVESELDDTNSVHKGFVTFAKDLMNSNGFTNDIGMNTYKRMRIFSAQDKRGAEAYLYQIVSFIDMLSEVVRDPSGDTSMQPDISQRRNVRNKFEVIQSSVWGNIQMKAFELYASLCNWQKQEDVVYTRALFESRILLPLPYNKQHNIAVRYTTVHSGRCFWDEVPPYFSSSSILLKPLISPDICYPSLYRDRKLMDANESFAYSMLKKVYSNEPTISHFVERYLELCEKYSSENQSTKSETLHLNKNLYDFFSHAMITFCRLYIEQSMADSTPAWLIKLRQCDKVLAFPLLSLPSAAIQQPQGIFVNQNFRFVSPSVCFLAPQCVPSMLKQMECTYPCLTSYFESNTVVLEKFHLVSADIPMEYLSIVYKIFPSLRPLWNSLEYRDIAIQNTFFSLSPAYSPSDAAVLQTSENPLLRHIHSLTAEVTSNNIVPFPILAKCAIVAMLLHNNIDISPALLDVIGSFDVIIGTIRCQYMLSTHKLWINSLAGMLLQHRKVILSVTSNNQLASTSISKLPTFLSNILTQRNFIISSPFFSSIRSQIRSMVRIFLNIFFNPVSENIAETDVTLITSPCINKKRVLLAIESILNEGLGVTSFHNMISEKRKNLYNPSVLQKLLPLLEAPEQYNGLHAHDMENILTFCENRDIPFQDLLLGESYDDITEWRTILESQQVRYETFLKAIKKLQAHFRMKGGSYNNKQIIDYIINYSRLTESVNSNGMALRQVPPLQNALILNPFLEDLSDVEMDENDEGRADGRFDRNQVVLDLLKQKVDQQFVEDLSNPSVLPTERNIFFPKKKSKKPVVVKAPSSLQWNGGERYMDDVKKRGLSEQNYITGFLGELFAFHVAIPIHLKSIFPKDEIVGMNESEVDRYLLKYGVVIHDAYKAYHIKSCKWIVIVTWMNGKGESLKPYDLQIDIFDQEAKTLSLASIIEVKATRTEKFTFNISSREYAATCSAKDIFNLLLIRNIKSMSPEWIFVREVQEAFSNPKNFFIHKMECTFVS